MGKKYEVCSNCSEKHCCRGLCKEMNKFLIDKEGDNNYSVYWKESKGRKRDFN